MFTKRETWVNKNPRPRTRNWFVASAVVQCTDLFEFFASQWLGLYGHEHWEYSFYTMVLTNFVKDLSNVHFKAWNPILTFRSWTDRKRYGVTFIWSHGQGDDVGSANSS